jgi:glycosyltransferase involved in cell wall biosynthesis
LLTPFLHLGDPDDPHDPVRRAYTAGPFRWLLRAADHVFVQTPSEHQAVCDVGVPAERVTRQGLGVEPADCTGGDRQRARAQWGVPSGDVVIGHLANNSIEKGTVDLLRAAERLWCGGTEFTVVLAGPEMPNFRQYFQQYPFADRVRRLGILSDHEKRDFYAGVDAFALPSRSDSFGLVLLEAWANRLPNVVYRAGGPADLVRDESDGLIAKCGDVDQLSAAVARLIADAGLRRALGKAGYRRVKGEFAWSDKLSIVRDVMTAVVKSHRSAPANQEMAGAAG